MGLPVLRRLVYNSLGSEKWLNAPSSCHCYVQICATLFLPLCRMENACLHWTRTKDYSKMYYINIADKGVFQKKPTASLLALLGVCVGQPHLAARFSLGRAHSDTCQSRLSEGHGAKQVERKGKHPRSPRDFL